MNEGASLYYNECGSYWEIGGEKAFLPETNEDPPFFTGSQQTHSHPSTRRPFSS